MPKLSPQAQKDIDILYVRVCKFIEIHSKYPHVSMKTELKKCETAQLILREYTSNPTAAEPDLNAKKEGKWLGGEVTNYSDRNWWVSGGSNSRPEHFISVPPGKNTDKMTSVQEILDSDVDAVWPGGFPLRIGRNGETVTSGAFKLRDHRNTDIYGNAEEGYYIEDYTSYFTEAELPEGWSFPF